MLDDWCPTCHTRHAGKVPCPGPLAPTGPERNGWRITVKTNRGHESYGVVVGPVHRQWLARILTYPDRFWTIPGAREAVKFLADSPGEAERQAIEHIRDRVQASGFAVVDLPRTSKRSLPPEVRAGRITEIVSPGRPGDEGGEEDDDESTRRKLCDLPVLFGHNTHSRQARVENVSERGLFVNTETPLETGSVIRLKVEMDSCSMPLRGVVVWTRTESDEGRSNGMGIRLNRPPALYVSYVRML